MLQGQRWFAKVYVRINDYTQDFCANVTDKPCFVDIWAKFIEMYMPILYVYANVKEDVIEMKVRCMTLHERHGILNHQQLHSYFSRSTNKSSPLRIVLVQ